MKKQVKIVIIFLVLLFLGLAFLDKTVFRLMGIKSIEKTFQQASPTVKPTLTPKKEQKAQSQEGYQWAEDNDISDPKKCSGHAKAFDDGCSSYVQDTANDALQDQDSDDQ